MTDTQATNPDSTPVQQHEIAIDPHSPEGQLYETVRLWRRAESHRRAETQQREVRPFHLFPNTTLREIVALRPGTVEALAQVFGMGPYRCASFGEPLVGVVVAACGRLGLAVAATLPPRAKQPAPPRPASTDAQRLAIAAFEAGCTLPEAKARSGLAASTLEKTLIKWARETKPASLLPWLDPQTCLRVRDVTTVDRPRRLKPIFEALGGTVPYVAIRLALLAEVQTEPARHAA